MDVFQFNSGVGLAMAKAIKATNPLEMTAANAMMRLMSEPGTESQQDRYIRIRDGGIELFDMEMQKAGLPEKTIAAMHTLIRFIIAALNLNPWELAYIAYTGKAAQVLRNKGCPNAMTAHRLLYKSHPREDGTFVHIPVETLAPRKLIVVDEISMLPKKMWEQLLYYKIHVIALGDPGQLPPVAAENNGVLEHPHIFLDEVMRQAAESEIIQLTMDIRAGKPLQYKSGNEVRIVTREKLLKPGFLFFPS